MNGVSLGSPPSPAWTGVLWALPVALVGMGRQPATTWRAARLRRARPRSCSPRPRPCRSPGAGVSAAQRQVAEERLSTLGNQVNPYLQFLLEGLSERTDSLFESGARGTGLLYDIWRASGLAQEGVAAWIDRWTPGGLPSDALRIGVSDPRPSIVDDYLDEAGSRNHGAATSVGGCTLPRSGGAAGPIGDHRCSSPAAKLRHGPVPGCALRAGPGRRGYRHPPAAQRRRSVAGGGGSAVGTNLAGMAWRTDHPFPRGMVQRTLRGGTPRDRRARGGNRARPCCSIC